MGNPRAAASPESVTLPWMMVSKDGDDGVGGELPNEVQEYGGVSM